MRLRLHPLHHFISTLVVITRNSLFLLAAPLLPFLVCFISFSFSASALASAAALCAKTSSESLSWVVVFMCAQAGTTYFFSAGLKLGPPAATAFVLLDGGGGNASWVDAGELTPGESEVELNKSALWNGWCEPKPEPNVGC